MDPTQAFFRVDASFEIGYGHLYRCLTLANAFGSLGIVCTFICRDLDGIPKDVIKSNGHNLELISTYKTHSGHNDHLSSLEESVWAYDAAITKNIIQKPIDLLIVDHYEIDYLWEKEVKDLSKSFIVIDDLANRKHDCDILIDQNLGSNLEDYRNLVPRGTKLFIGPEFALLRPEFKKYRNFSLKRRKDLEIKNILVSLGGVDRNNFIEKILTTLKNINLRMLSKVDVVLGKGNDQKESLKEIGKSFPITLNFYQDVKNMANLMSQADLIIGAGGISSWERCSLGIPSIIFILADNQKKGAYALEKENCSIVINENQSFEDNLIFALDHFSIKSNMKKSINSCKNISDGEGVNKILKAIFSK